MVSINPTMLVLVMLNFAALLFALYKLLWGPLIGLLDERERTIREELAAAAKAREEAEALAAEHKARLDEAKGEALSILEVAREQAEALREEALAQARKDAARILEQAEREAELAAAKVKAELREEVARLSVEMAGAILAREISPADHEELIKMGLARLGPE